MAAWPMRSKRIGETIKWWRLARGLSQKDVAKRSGLHVTQISLLERGVGNPRVDTLDKVATALGAILSVRFEHPNPADPLVEDWSHGDHGGRLR